MSDGALSPDAAIPPDVGEFIDLSLADQSSALSAAVNGIADAVDAGLVQQQQQLDRVTRRLESQTRRGAGRLQDAIAPALDAIQSQIESQLAEQRIALARRRDYSAGPANTEDVPAGVWWSVGDGQRQPWPPPAGLAWDLYERLIYGFSHWSRESVQGTSGICVSGRDVDAAMRSLVTGEYSASWLRVTHLCEPVPSVTADAPPSVTADAPPVFIDPALSVVVAEPAPERELAFPVDLDQPIAMALSPVSELWAGRLAERGLGWVYGIMDGEAVDHMDAPEIDEWTEPPVPGLGAGAPQELYRGIVSTQ